MHVEHLNGLINQVTSQETLEQVVQTIWDDENPHRRPEEWEAEMLVESVLRLYLFEDKSSTDYFRELSNFTI